MDVLALCRFDDSILICQCWITKGRGEGDILQVMIGALTVWSWSDTREGGFFFSVFTRCGPKGVVLVGASRRRAWSHLTDMEATPAVTLHLWRLERETMSRLTGAAEGEEPKCLRHTWLRAKHCSSFTLVFFVFNFILHDLSNLYMMLLKWDWDVIIE